MNSWTGRLGFEFNGVTMKSCWICDEAPTITILSLKVAVGVVRFPKGGMEDLPGGERRVSIIRAKTKEVITLVFGEYQRRVQVSLARALTSKYKPRRPRLAPHPRVDVRR